MAGQGKRHREEHDSNDADDVRYHGESAREIARVGPDEADDRSDDENGNRRG